MKSIKKQIARQKAFYQAKEQKRPIKSTPNPKLFKTNPLLTINQERFALDLDELKGKSLEEKAKLKRHLLARYEAQINAYIKTGQGQNDLFAYAVQWQFDVGDLDKYIRYTDIAMARKVKPVVRANKTFAECLHYDILDWADEQHKEKQSIEPYLTLCMKRVEDWNQIPNKQRSSFWYLKFHSQLRSGTREETIELGKVAYKEHKAQIKTKLKDLFLEQWGKEDGKTRWKEFEKE